MNNYSKLTNVHTKVGMILNALSLCFAGLKARQCKHSQLLGTGHKLEGGGGGGGGEGWCKHGEGH